MMTRGFATLHVFARRTVAAVRTATTTTQSGGGGGGGGARGVRTVRARVTNAPFGSSMRTVTTRAVRGEESEDDATPASFRDLGVGAKLARALSSVGIETPSIAQRAAVPAIMKGENVAMQSHTGSGKTLAYLLPIICELFDENTGTVRADVGNGVRALVVAPSQELAMQIVRQVERVLGPLGRQITQQAIGGANARRQEEAIRKKRPLIVVGTPGRLAELSRAGILQTHGVRTLVIDEADDLLASNFRRDMARISDHTGKGIPGGRQTVIVSATLKQETLDAYAYLAPNLQAHRRDVR
jgi:superfamily II DNA/RNA helicase